MPSKYIVVYAHGVKFQQSLHGVEYVKHDCFHKSTRAVNQSPWQAAWHYTFDKTCACFLERTNYHTFLYLLSLFIFYVRDIWGPKFQGVIWESVLVSLNEKWSKKVYCFALSYLISCIIFRRHSWQSLRSGARPSMWSPQFGKFQCSWEVWYEVTSLSARRYSGSFSHSREIRWPIYLRRRGFGIYTSSSLLHSHGPFAELITNVHSSILQFEQRLKRLVEYS